MDNLTLIKNGLWHNNPALMQLLGLCPLLAVSNSFISSFTLGIATIFVLTTSNTIISFFKKYISYDLRIPFFMLIISSVVTVIILAMKAISYNLYQTLGVYLALITTNCVILGRIEAFAYKNSISKAALDGLSNGLGFSLVLILLGSIREVIGQGTLFANCHLLFGDYANNFVLRIHTPDSNFIIALLPPGAFFILGLLIAFKNIITARYLNNKANNRIHNNINEQATKIKDIPTISKS